MNDEAFVEAAQAFGMRIQNHSEFKNDSDKIAMAFELCTSRIPDSKEMEILSEILKRERNNSNKKYDEWYTLAAVLLNMHQTITRR